MNIAFVNPEYPPLSGLGHGGIATYIYNMANACASQGHTVHILAREATRHDRLHPAVEWHEFGHAPLKGPFSALSRFRGAQIHWERCCAQAVRNLLFDLHRKKALDIVEIPEYGGLSRQLYGKLPFRVVIHFHTPTQLIDTLNGVHLTKSQIHIHDFEKRACRNAHAYKSPSFALKRYINSHMKISSERITVIHTLMPTEEFDCIKKARPNPRRINVLFAGRLERRKGAELLIDTMNDILRLDERIHLTVVGETELNEANSYREALERALEKEYRSRLWILGPTDRKQVAVLYRRSSIFLMLSPFENAPNALLEAMAARLPVISTDGGGNAECVTHRRNGLVFSAEDRTGLIDRVKECVENPHFAKKLATQAYKDVKSMYDPGCIAEETVAFYRKVLLGV